MAQSFRSKALRPSQYQPVAPVVGEHESRPDKAEDSPYLYRRISDPQSGNNRDRTPVPDTRVRETDSGNESVASEKSELLESVPEQPTRPPSVFWIWRIELFAILISVIAFIGIIVLLYPYRSPAAVPDWPYEISVNTVVSILTMILRAGLLVALSEALSQQKWIWFAGHKDRQLLDMVAFDQASRGPFGALVLLSRGSTWRSLGSLGAIAMILTIAIGPFAQQLVVFTTCSLPDHSRDASVSRVQNVPAAAWSTAGPHVSVQNMLLSTLYTPQLVPILMDCPSGDCNFAAFDTVGLCSSCEDVSDQIKISSHNQTYRLPPSTSVLNVATSGSTELSAQTDFQPTPASSDIQELQSILLLPTESTILKVPSASGSSELSTTQHGSDPSDTPRDPASPTSTDPQEAVITSAMLILPTTESFLDIPTESVQPASPTTDSILMLPSTQAMLVLPSTQAGAEIPSTEATQVPPSPQTVLELPSTEPVLMLPSSAAMLELPSSAKSNSPTSTLVPATVSKGPKDSQSPTPVPDRVSSTSGKVESATQIATGSESANDKGKRDNDATGTKESALHSSTATATAQSSSTTGSPGVERHVVVEYTNLTLPSGMFLTRIAQYNETQKTNEFHNTSNGLVNVGFATTNMSTEVDDAQAVTQVQRRYQMIYQAPKLDSCNQTEASAPTSSWQCRGHGAAECSIVPCVQTIAASMANGTVTELVSRMTTNWAYISTPSNQTLQTLNVSCLSADQRTQLTKQGYNITSTTDWLAYKEALNSTTKIGSQPVPQACYYQIDRDTWNAFNNQIDRLITGDTAATIMAMMYNDTNASFSSLSRIVQDIALGATNGLRSAKISSAANQPAIGAIFEHSTCVQVRWAWLAYPAAMIVLTTAFLVVTMFDTSLQMQRVEGSSRLRPAGSWKSSVLPFMFHGLEDWRLRSRDPSRLVTSAEMERAAGSVRVRLAPAEDGWKLVPESAGR